MKLVLNMVVKNEEDIIELNILHHLDQGVDFINVLNHNSTDNTSSILDYYASKNVLKHYKTNEKRFVQGHFMTYLASEAVKSGADWILHGDADEFFYSINGMKDYLTAQPEDCHAINLFHYNSRINYGDDFRQATKFEPGTTKVISRGLLGFKIEDGNHWCNANPDNVITDTSHLALIYHFPYRTEKSTYNKLVVGGENIATNFPDGNKGEHWVEGYKKFKTDKNSYKEYVRKLFSERDETKIINDSTMKNIFGKYSRTNR